MTFDCIDHLTRAGRFSVLTPGTQGETSTSDVPCEFDVSGTQLSLEDEWRAVYSERLQQSKQLLSANTQRDNSHNILHWENVAHDLPPSIQTNRDQHVDQNVPVFGCLGVSSADPNQQSIADSIANQFSLNGEQRQAYVLVTWQAIADQLAPLRMYIEGCGGTGKTRVILTLNEFFRQISQSR